MILRRRAIAGGAVHYILYLLNTASSCKMIVDVLRRLHFGMMATIGDDEQVPLLLYDLNCGAMAAKQER